MEDQHAAEEQRKKRAFRKVTYRGLELDQLLDQTPKQLSQIVGSRVRRRLDRGLKRKQQQLLKKLKQAKKKVVAPEKPDPVKTHVRNMPIVPEMVGSIIGVYNGKVFNQVEVKTDMVGHYLAEFSMSYKPVKHGRPGIGATHSSRFIPLK